MADIMDSRVVVIVMVLVASLVSTDARKPDYPICECLSMIIVFV